MYTIHFKNGQHDNRYLFYFNRFLAYEKNYDNIIEFIINNYE